MCYNRSNKNKRSRGIPMRKKLIFLILLALFLFPSCQSNCKPNTDSRKSVEEIKRTYKYFDITVDYNGVIYRVIKSSEGNYYENTKQSDFVYYNIEENRSYTIDEHVKYEEEINYDFSKKIETIYEVLTMHLDSKNFTNLLTSKTTYINRSVTKYYRSNDELVEETYYVDDETGACLYFCLGDGTKRVVGKINALQLGDQSLAVYDEYETLRRVDLSQIQKELAIRDNFQTYDITFDINGDVYRMISTNEGLYLKNASGENLYIASEDTWYEVSSINQTKTVISLDKTREDVEELIFTSLLSHVNQIDNTFFVCENQIYLGRNVNIYVKTSRSNSEVYKQKYYVDIETGACLKKEIANSSFTITEYEQNASLQEIMAYETIERTSYDTWPEQHPYLEGIAEITFGTFERAMIIDGGLYIFYHDIIQNDYLNILADMKAYGFTIQDSTPVESETYRCYMASRSDGLKLVLEFAVNEKELTIILKK